jgi:replicative DNA helicase
MRKQRNYPTGSVDVHYHKQFTRFDNHTNRPEQEN